MVLQLMEVVGLGIANNELYATSIIICDELYISVQIIAFIDKMSMVYKITHSSIFR